MSLPFLLILFLPFSLVNFGAVPLYFSVMHMYVLCVYGFVCRSVLMNVGMALYLYVLSILFFYIVCISYPVALWNYVFYKCI